jgi:alanine racemase
LVQSGRRATIDDVAQRAGVSKTSVSFAFNKPTRLRPETARRIRDVAEALGYQPHPVARMLGERRTRTLGVLMPQALAVIFENPFFGTFSAGAAEAAEESDYALQFISASKGSLSGAVRGATIDGFVAIGLSAHHPEVEQIQRADLPMVLVDSASHPKHPSIDVDDEKGARDAAEHVASLGHRDILVLGIEPPIRSPEAYEDSVMARRMRGYRAGLAVHDVFLPDTSIVAGAATIESGRKCFHAAWAAGRRPTAVLAMGDAIAIGAMRAVRDLDMRVPDDISIVGFDDIQLAEYMDPPLTTVHQPVRQKARDAVQLLIDTLDGTAEHGRHATLATRLIVRGSTGPAPVAAAATGASGRR